ncbi:unnamed protein product, partial [Dovyalis caffra]
SVARSRIRSEREFEVSLYRFAFVTESIVQEGALIRFMHRMQAARDRELRDDP